MFWGDFFMGKKQNVAINQLINQSKGGNKFMNKTFKKIIAAVATFGFVFSGFASSSLAEGTSTISGGTLSMSSATIGNFSGITLNGQVQTTNASIGNFSVTDATGTGNGWNVVVKATQFTDSVNNVTLPTGSLDIALPTVTAQTGASDVSTITTSSGKVDNATGVKVLSAALNGGMGEYDVTYATNALTLTLLPKDVKAGTYTSTISVTLTTGP
jgi:hypothetical protein